MLAAARRYCQGSLGVLAIAVISLVASSLVMASVVAVSRQRQIYEASVMHAVGTRMKLIMRSVAYEYTFLAVTLTVFAAVAGLRYSLAHTCILAEVPVNGVWLAGLLVAAIASSTA